MSPRFALLPLISLPFFAVPAIAAGDAGGVSCHDSASYYVIARESPSDEGSDILVKHKPAPGDLPPCKYRVKSSDLEIKNSEDAQSYLGIAGDFLVLDSGTGNVRALVVWDLKKRKKVFEDQYSEPIEIKPDRLEFWSETGPASKSKCPDLADWEGDVVTETRTTLALPSLEITRHRKTRCSARE